MSAESQTQIEPPIELFRYLRKLVDEAEAATNPYPKFALVEAYWHIGRIIVEIEQQGQHRADYGIHLIESLSQQLTEAFGKGYSLPNMWRFKQFFLAFPILSTIGRELGMLRMHLRTELCWSHYRTLMQLENLSEREFYIQKAADERWTVRFMQQMIRNRFYHRNNLIDNKLIPTNLSLSESATSERITSSTLSAVGGAPRTRLANIKKLLLERYVGYAFVAQRQFVSVEGEEQWAELVFFQYTLNRFVLVQLGEHTPDNTGQFQRLLNAYTARQPPNIDKLPIGLLINQVGQIKLQTTSQEPTLPAEEALGLPQFFT